MKVTFDSNVWEVILDDAKTAADPSPSAIAAIKQGIMDGDVHPFLPETIFTLEAIHRKIRKDYVGARKVVTKTEEVEASGNEVGLRMVLGPEPGAHPGNTPQLQKYLEAGLKLGFLLMRLPRIALPLNPDLKESMYYQHYDRTDRHWEYTTGIARKLEAAGFGISQLKAIGLSHRMGSDAWFKGIRALPDDQWKKVADAVAEWADGDAITMHIAYGNDYFCTRDQGRGAGSRSILAPANRAWLESEYEVKFVSPEELAEIIKNSETTG